MTNELIEYVKIHLISLEQDSAKLYVQLEEWQDDFDNDEYKDLEMQDVSLTGQIIALNHILAYADELDNSRSTMVG